MKGQCHCRECQYISGGSPNVLMGVPEDSFAYTKGEPKHFKRADLENGSTREFCGTCGTHIVSRVPNMPLVFIKVGTLDDPSIFGMPDMAIFTLDKQTFHTIPEGVASYERLPG